MTLSRENSSRVFGSIFLRLGSYRVHDKGLREMKLHSYPCDDCIGRGLVRLETYGFWNGSTFFESPRIKGRVFGVSAPKMFGFG